MLTEMRTVFAEPGDPAGRLRALVHAHARFHAANSTAARVANYELGALNARKRAEVMVLRRAIESVIGEALRLGVVSGDFDVPDPHLTTISILAMGVDVSRWFSAAKPLTPDDVGRHHGDLAVRMVQRRCEPGGGPGRRRGDRSASGPGPC
jgi:hypothetical protein